MDERVAEADWGDYKRGLSGIFARYHGRLAERAYLDAEAELGRAIPRDRDGVAEVLRSIGKQVDGITATQQDRVTRLVSDYAGDDRSALLADLTDALEDNAGFANRIAATETSRVYNLVTAQATASAGLKHCYVTDGDDDPPCSEVNGTYQTLAWCADNPLAHPHCTRTFYPDDREGED